MSKKTTNMFKVIIIITFSLSLSIFLNNTETKALFGWNAGSIIDDVIFTKNTMSVTQIQTFLNSKVSNCDTNGILPASEFGRPDLTHAQYAALKGWSPPPYTCLKDYTENNIKSAQIIFNASQQYNINPQVLIVLLQKEQGLVTDTWPLATQYRAATGYGCPDTAACSSTYYGFTNQVNWAATMYHAIMSDSPTWYTPYNLGNNYVQYNPVTTCGGTNVYIQNRATQALYNYTPYQPNQAALDAGYGSAPCGAYGNRNFYLYFTSWFGTTKAYTSMTNPRWMETKNIVYKINPATGVEIGEAIPIGTQFMFNTKVTVEGEVYLRPSNDTSSGAMTGIKLSDLSEITPVFEPMVTPRWLELKQDTKKIDPITEKTVSGTIPAGAKIYFPSKYEIGGVTYLRTQRDTDNGLSYGIKLNDLKETLVEIEPASQPRWMRVKTDSSTYNITNYNNETNITSGDHIFIDKKIFINNTLFVNNSANITPGEYEGILYSDLEEIQPIYSSVIIPRWMAINKNTSKVNPITEGLIANSSILNSTKLYISSTISVGSKDYLRTREDTTLNLNYGIKLSDLSEITPVFEPMVTPRWLELKQDTKKIDPITEKTVSGTIPAGAKIYFPSKYEIGGVTYLRTQHDSDASLDYGIKYNDLKEI